MFQRSIHFSRRLGCLAALLLVVGSSGGCSLWNWNKETWNLDRYRDERAVDIDHRLDKAVPIVKNPF